jgi:hypothetical protein
VVIAQDHRGEHVYGLPVLVGGDRDSLRCGQPRLRQPWPPHDLAVLVRRSHVDCPTQRRGRDRIHPAFTRSTGPQPRPRSPGPRSVHCRS